MPDLTPSEPFRPDPKVVVGLGDSTTAGTPGFRSPVEAPPRGEGDPRSQYAWWLARAEPHWRVLNHGVNRQRTEAIAARFDRDVLAHRPDAVILLAGVNDVYDGDAPAAIAARLDALYARARSARLPVVACTILPFDTATPAHVQAIDVVNAWIRRAAADTPGLTLCDTHAAVRHADDPHRLDGSPDGLHPSVDGYRRMAEALAPAVHAALRAR